MDSYYYLIASLPTLELGGDHTELNFSEALQSIKRNLREEDLALLQYLILANDNRNLVESIMKKHQGLSPEKFYSPSEFDENTIRNFIHHQNSFPEYMVSFLDDQLDSTAVMSQREIENILFQYYYEQVISLPDSFLQQYIKLENDLSLIIASWNCLQYENEKPQYVIPEDTRIEKVIRSKQAEAVLSMEFPFIRALLGSLETKDPMEISMTVDRIKWDYIDELNATSFFSRQQVFGYYLKLEMAQRWRDLDASKGIEKLVKLKTELLETSEMESL